MLYVKPETPHTVLLDVYKRQDLRHYFDKNGGNLGQSGCVGFMFDRKGLIVIEKTDSVDEDTLMMDALEAGADDFNVEDECYEILTAPEALGKTREELESKGYTFAQAEVNYIPQTTTKLDNPEDIAKMEKLIDMLEENDDCLLYTSPLAGNRVK